MPPALGQPICSNCGYDLTGAVSSPTCPECGRPIVEVLQRKPTENSAHYKRYSSKATLFGLPLIDIAYGPDPGQKVGKAVGVIAVGDHATGFVAVGGFARGGLCIGGMCLGVLCFGGMSIGLVGATGGLAVAGVVAMGGIAASGYFAVGGLALSHRGAGGLFIPLW